MSFRIHAVPLAPFQSLFAFSDAALLAIGARRMIADTPHSAPCRVSLVDAAPGEELILISHRHLDDLTSPYRAEGPIFVRQSAVEARPAAGEVPDMLARRLLSVRAYDADWMMTDADVVEGQDLADWLVQSFAADRVARVQMHTARRGCFLAAAGRV